jgi:hypothetical protein
METAHLRHLCHVHLRKVGLSLLLIFAACSAHTQINYFENGGKLLYFGIALGGNASDYKLVSAPIFQRHDSISSYNVIQGPGFNLGIIGNLQVHKYFDIRFIPNLTFAERKISYNMTDGGPPQVKSISSIYVDLPLEFRYKSKPIKDFRLFVMAGMRYNFDLNSNSKSRKSQDILKVTPHNLEVEYGIGFQYYFPYFIISPELKLSHGLLNIGAKNDALIYQRIFDKMFSRMFTITLNFEG